MTASEYFQQFGAAALPAGGPAEGSTDTAEAPEPGLPAAEPPATDDGTPR